MYKYKDKDNDNEISDIVLNYELDYIANENNDSYILRQHEAIEREIKTYIKRNLQQNKTLILGYGIKTYFFL